MNTKEYMTFTPKKLKLLKAAYKKAVEEKREVFSFDGKELFVGYAKYLIEYLEGRMESDLHSV